MLEERIRTNYLHVQLEKLEQWQMKPKDRRKWHIREINVTEYMQKRTNVAKSGLVQKTNKIDKQLVIAIKKNK